MEKKWGSNLNQQKNNQTSLLFFFFFATANMLFLGGERRKKEGRKNTLLELNRQSDHRTLLTTLSHYCNKGSEMHQKSFWTLTFRVFLGPQTPLERRRQHLLATTTTTFEFKYIFIYFKRPNSLDSTWE
jgi:hypothetical protein